MKNHRAWLGAAALLTLGLASGCGPRTGTVSGQVLYENKPLPGGMVSFLPVQPGRNPTMATIGTDGHYELTLPTGEYQIAIDNRELEPRHKAPPLRLPPGVKLSPGITQAPPTKGEASPPPTQARLPGEYVRIPEKYYLGTTSGLAYTVRGGAQNFDIPLK